MSNTEAIHGLSCPYCGGMVPIPEGQVIVICPYCNQSAAVAATAVTPEAAAPSAAVPAVLPADGSGLFQSAAVGELPVPAPAVQGDNLAPVSDAGEVLGVRRYQVPLRVTREQVSGALKGFLAGKIQVARDCASRAELKEVFLVHLPFWTVWGRGVAYGFGQVQVGSGDHKRWESREKKAIREMTWNIPACEVGEFGVKQVSLKDRPLLPFNALELHGSGMVFEPVGSAQSALETARQNFNATIKNEVKMERTGQMFTRLVRTRLGLVYYPLWVLRYDYRGRAFSVVVDGFNGDVLYGKAPGSVGYRAAVLIGGMALGSLVTVDGPALILSASNNHSDDNPLVGALIVFVIGIAILFGAYRVFRYAEQYEYHRYKPQKVISGDDWMSMLPLNLPGTKADVQNAMRQIERFR